MVLCAPVVFIFCLLPSSSQHLILMLHEPLPKRTILLRFQPKATTNNYCIQSFKLYAIIVGSHVVQDQNISNLLPKETALCRLSSLLLVFYEHLNVCIVRTLKNLFTVSKMKEFELRTKAYAKFLIPF